MWVWSSDSLRMYRIQWKWWNSPSNIILPKSMIPLFPCLLWWSQLPYYKLPYGKAHVARGWGSALANRQQGTETLNPVAHKELSPVIIHSLNDLRSGCLPIWALSEGRPGRLLDYSLWDPELDDPAKLYLHSWPIGAVMSAVHMNLSC